MDKNLLKLTDAVYKLLEYFPESDPLKNRAKDKALAITENWASFQDPKGIERAKIQILEDIDVLLGYLWIGKTQGWLNFVNCLIVSNEYEKLKKSVQNLPLANIVAGPQQSSPKASLGGEQISPRQRKIVEFLTKNEKGQVMDLQTVLPDVTKRTIRRDLDELLGQGKIDRMGGFNQIFYKIKQ